MKKVIIVGLLSLGLVACGNAHKKQFVQACSHGMGGVEGEICECIYDKAIDFYGKDQMDDFAKKGWMPDDFMNRSLEFAATCRMKYQ